MAMNIDKQEKSASDETTSVAPLARYFLWADTESGVNRLIKILVGLCVFLFLIDIVWPRHGRVPGEELWGFHAIAGFVSFSVIVIGARFLRIFIKHDETFYAPNSIDAEEYPQADTEQLEYNEWPKDSIVSFSEEVLGRKLEDVGGKSS